MRLIDTKTHLLLEPWKAAGKEYAILSHTWGDQEVIFQEWEQLYPSGAIKGQCPHVRHQGIDKKAGYFKVMQACEQAQRDGFRYLWCDTMCINKESSAELSEAINSMFKWYRDAKVCYVYLSDVTFHNNRFKNIGGPSFCTPNHSNVSGWFKQITARELHSDVHEMKSRLMASRWWTRGWTLQELLAPKKVAFFMQDWGLLGHKSDLAHLISASTRIHRQALEDPAAIINFSIAQRMSWAADRQTTVAEDMAYCLLGIFNINMPLLYGQGEGAFQKLQHEIIKSSDDQSIFAWFMDPTDKTPWTGALARSPRFFRNCGSIVRDPQHNQAPYSITNIGFKMRVPMIQNPLMSQNFIGLGCFLELHTESHLEGSVVSSSRKVPVWIPVRERGYGGLYERIHNPASHLYLQSSYTSNNIISSPEIFFCELPYHNVLDQRISSPEGTMHYSITNDVHRTGIVIAVGFGDMSKMSRAYKDIWLPRKFNMIAMGSREPRHSSHAVIFSGTYCIILSVAWNDYGKPSTQTHTTLRSTDAKFLPQVLSQLHQAVQREQTRNDPTTVHESIRSTNTLFIAAGGDCEAPMIVVEDEPLYDMQKLASVMVEIIFREKRIPTGNRENPL